MKYPHRTKKVRPRKIIHIKVHTLSYILVIAAAVLIAAMLSWSFGKRWLDDRRESNYQKSIGAFYQPPELLPATQPGRIVRSEKMPNVKVPRGGSAYRILYVTQKPDGAPAVSSGMVFVPQGAAPAEGRKVVAWAHGTLGFGVNCTPSRSRTNQLNDMGAWLDAAMQRGYVVTATDYVGVGTPGEPYYLIGKSEAYDVLNSVRAARQLAEAKASSAFVVWGHSQGGHSALFAGLEAATYAPELTLKGVAASAPAAELGALFKQQYGTTVSWAIGPDAAVSWPKVYKDLPIESMLTKDARRNYKQLANGCLQQQGLGLTIRHELKSQFFATDPTRDPAWQRAIAAETPKVTNITMPLYLSQGLMDIVVLPNTTALLVQKACSSKQDVTVDWLGDINHGNVATVSGPRMMEWTQDVFQGKPVRSSCGQPLPVEVAN